MLFNTQNRSVALLTGWLYQQQRRNRQIQRTRKERIDEVQWGIRQTMRPGRRLLKYLHISKEAFTVSQLGSEHSSGETSAPLLTAFFEESRSTEGTGKYADRKF